METFPRRTAYLQVTYYHTLKTTQRIDCLLSILGWCYTNTAIPGLPSSTIHIAHTLYSRPLCRLALGNAVEFATSPMRASSAMNPGETWASSSLLPLSIQPLKLKTP